MKTTTAITALTALVLFAGTFTTVSAAPSSRDLVNKQQREREQRNETARIRLTLETKVSKLEKNLKELQERYDAMEKRFFASEGRAAKAERELHQVKAQLRAAEAKSKGEKPDELSELVGQDKDKDKDK